MSSPSWAWRHGPCFISAKWNEIKQYLLNHVDNSTQRTTSLRFNILFHFPSISPFVTSEAALSSMYKCKTARGRIRHGRFRLSGPDFPVQIFQSRFTRHDMRSRIDRAKNFLKSDVPRNLSLEDQLVYHNYSKLLFLCMSFFSLRWRLNFNTKIVPKFLLS